MSTCSLRFPTNLSNFLQSSGVAGTVPDWSMSTDKDQICINLVWKTNITDNVGFVPPMPYRSNTVIRPNTHVPRPYQKEYPRNRKNTYEIPPRFVASSSKTSNSIYSDTNSHVHLNDTNTVTTGTSDTSHTVDHTITSYESDDRLVGCVSSSVSNHSQVILDGNMSDKCETTMIGTPVKTKITREKSIDTLDDFIDTSYTAVCDMNEYHSSLDDIINNYIRPSPIDSVTSEYGISSDAREGLLINRDHSKNIVHAQLHQCAISSSECKLSANGIIKDTINSSTRSEISNGSSDDTNTKKALVLDHVDMNDNIGNSSKSHSLSSVGVKLPKLAPIESNDYPNSISLNPPNEKGVNDEHNVNSASTSGSIVCSDSTSHCVNHNANKPVRSLTEDEDRESIEMWIVEVTKYLSQFSLFEQFLPDSCTWSVYSKKNSTRGLQDNDIPAGLRITHLNTMLEEIGSFVPTMDSRYLNKKCTSLRSIWSMIFIHYQC